MSEEITVKKTTSFLSENNVMLLLTFVFALFYYLFSQFSEGFYQHDEVAHFVNMRGFWQDPYSVLGNWAKPGYKLIYAIPALFGEQVVLLMNCVFAAFTAFFSYKIARIHSEKFGYLAFFLLALQPMWMQLAFRNYSEVITAFLVVVTLYAHYKERFVLAALLLSYTVLIRQEFYVFVGFYGLYLLLKKRFIPMLLLVVFPLLINFWGYSSTGDIFYLINSTLDMGAAISDAYPRQGFGHYWLMSEVIFGAISLVLAMAYIGLKVIRWKSSKKQWFLIVPALLFILVHSVFNYQAHPIGPATGGNLRYLIIISPLIAIMGALAFEEVYTLPKKTKLIIVLLPIIILIGTFMTYDHNNIKFSEARNYVPVMIALLSAVLLFLPLKKIKPVVFAFVLTVVSVVALKAEVKSFQLSEEDKAMQYFVDWYTLETQKDDGKIKAAAPIYVNHTLFYYYQGKTAYDFTPKGRIIRQESIDTSKVGDVVIWESHYSYRPKKKATSLPVNYFLARPNEYAEVYSQRTKSNKFLIKVFEKVSEADSNFNKGMALIQKNDYVKALPYFDKALVKSQNFATYLYAGMCYQNTKSHEKALDYYNKSLELNTNNHLAYLNRAGLLSALGKYDEAFADINEALKLDTKTANSYLIRGSIYLNKNQLEPAIADFVEGIRLAPKNANAYYYLGLAQMRANKKDAGCKNLQRSAQLGNSQAVGLVQQYCGK